MFTPGTRRYQSYHILPPNIASATKRFVESLRNWRTKERYIEMESQWYCGAAEKKLTTPKSNPSKVALIIGDNENQALSHGQGGFHGEFFRSFAEKWRALRYK